jgi:hypothetical protein
MLDRALVLVRDSRVRRVHLELLLGGFLLPFAFAACTSECGTTIPAGGLAPGVHSLEAFAADRAGNEARFELDFRTVADVEGLRCLLQAGACGGIDNDGIRASLAAKTTAAANAEADGNLREASNILAGLVKETAAQRGQHVPAPCASLIIDFAMSLIHDRWGISLQQLR